MTVYLDHNATSPLRPEARDAALEAMACTGNASSVHRNGQKARALLEAARERVAAVCECAATRVLFTSGGTEANDLALCGSARARVLVSAVEHPSVLLARDGADIVPVDRHGVVDMAALDSLLASDDRPALVSVMAANNETGVIQPLDEIVRLAHGHAALVHTDAVQAAGGDDCAWRHADMISLSGHKLGGLPGAGALVVRDTARIGPRLRGGGQEFGYRAGTDALPAAASLGAALAAAARDDGRVRARLRDGMEARMRRAVPRSVVPGGDARRLPGTLCIAHPSVDARIAVMRFDLKGIAISAGAACSSGKVTPSHVLEAMGEPGLARRAVRLSLGWSSLPSDCDAAVGAWAALDNRLAGVSRAA